LCADKTSIRAQWLIFRIAFMITQMMVFRRVFWITLCLCGPRRRGVFFYCSSICEESEPLRAFTDRSNSRRLSRVH